MHHLDLFSLYSRPAHWAGAPWSLIVFSNTLMGSVQACYTYWSPLSCPRRPPSNVGSMAVYLVRWGEREGVGINYSHRGIRTNVGESRKVSLFGGISRPEAAPPPQKKRKVKWLMLQELTALGLLLLDPLKGQGGCRHGTASGLGRPLTPNPVDS